MFVVDLMLTKFYYNKNNVNEILIPTISSKNLIVSLITNLIHLC